MAGKKYADATRRYDRQMMHEPAQAIDMVRTFATAKFDESVELSVRLGVDPRKADQMVRGTVALPSGTGGDVRVAVFAQGDAAAAASEAGADIVGGADLAERVEAGYTEFDVAIATPDMMGVVGRLGKVLGPRGLMPQSQVGHGDPRCRQGRRRVQGRQGGIPHRSLRQRAPRNWQGQLLGRRLECEPRGGHGRAHSCAAPPAPRGATSARWWFPRRWVPEFRSTPPTSADRGGWTQLRPPVAFWLLQPARRRSPVAPA